MISASAALRLPSAQLSHEEARAADVLELAIENHVRAHMTRAGCEEEFTTQETRSSVLAEVTHRLHADGWIPQWQPNARPSMVGRGVVVVGWKLAALSPTQEAQTTAAAVMATADLRSLVEEYAATLERKGADLRKLQQEVRADPVACHLSDTHECTVEKDRLADKASTYEAEARAVRDLLARAAITDSA